MAHISITLTDDIDIGPYSVSNPNIIGTRINTWYRGRDENIAGLSQDMVNFHGTREQLTAFAKDLLEKVTLTKWVPEPETIGGGISIITPDGIVPIEEYKPESETKIAYSTSGKPLAAY